MTEREDTKTRNFPPNSLVCTDSKNSVDPAVTQNCVASVTYKFDYFSQDVIQKYFVTFLWKQIYMKKKNQKWFHPIVHEYVKIKMLFAAPWNWIHFVVKSFCDKYLWKIVVGMYVIHKNETILGLWSLIFPYLQLF